MSNCPVCKKEIQPEEIRYMLGLEKPYMNIFFHMECYKSISDMTEFLKQNIDSIIQNLYENKKKNR